MFLATPHPYRLQEKEKEKEEEEEEEHGGRGESWKRMKKERNSEEDRGQKQPMHGTSHSLLPPDQACRPHMQMDPWPLGHTQSALCPCRGLPDQKMSSLFVG